MLILETHPLLYTYLILLLFFRPSGLDLCLLVTFLSKKRPCRGFWFNSFLLLLDVRSFVTVGQVPVDTLNQLLWGFSP